MLARVFAFLPTLGFQEMFVLVLLGVLLYGRNLPEVGRKVGKTVAQLRRGMQEFKAQMDRDESVRELRDTLRETKDEVRRAGTVPRALTDPTGALRDLAREAAAEAERTTPELPETPVQPPEGKSDA
jgi:Sec-independent protein translocase protein TatA